MPLGYCELYLAYVHSQTNPPTWTKFGANRSSHLTVYLDFWICDPLPPPKCPLGYWGATWIQPVSIPRWIRRREPKSVPIGPAVWQLRQTFECSIPKTPKCTPYVSRGNLFGVYPFPDGSADVCQIWGQSLQPFDSFPILLNLWHPTPPPLKCTWGIEGRLVFGLCPFPDESADVNQSWCQQRTASQAFELLTP